MIHPIVKKFPEKLFRHAKIFILASIRNKAKKSSSLRKKTKQWSFLALFILLAVLIFPWVWMVTRFITQKDIFVRK